MEAEAAAGADGPASGAERPASGKQLFTVSLLGPVDPSFRALSGRLGFTVRRHKFSKDSLFSSFAAPHRYEVAWIFNVRIRRFGADKGVCNRLVVGSPRGLADTAIEGFGTQ